MSYLPGKFIWFEHVSSDIPKARAFYEPLFGWHTETMPMGDKTYHMIQNGDVGIGGFCPPTAGTPVGWVSYMSVTDVDASYAAALAAGAKPLEPPTDFPPVGRGASFADPTGAATSIWRSNEGDRPEVENPPFNEWCWNELWTQDDAKALAFYEKVFGYKHETMHSADWRALPRAAKCRRQGARRADEDARPQRADALVSVRGGRRLRCDGRKGPGPRRPGDDAAHRHSQRRSHRGADRSAEGADCADQAGPHGDLSARPASAGHRPRQYVIARASRLGCAMRSAPPRQARAAVPARRRAGARRDLQRQGNLLHIARRRSAMPAGLPSFAALPGATSGPGARKTARRRYASSAIPTSSAPMAPWAASSRAPGSSRSGWRRNGRPARPGASWWCSPAASRCCKWTPN